MATFYDRSIPQFQSILKTFLGISKKGQEWLKENSDVTEETLLSSRLIINMYPASKQIGMVTGGINNLIDDHFPSMTRLTPPDNITTFAELDAHIEEALARLAEFDVEAINAVADKPIVGGDRRKYEVDVPHTSDFIANMALPNAMFHLTVFYSILRSVGVPVGKRDFLGAFLSPDLQQAWGNMRRITPPSS